MGKRIAPEQQAATAGRKRKRVCNDFQQDTKSDQQKWVEESTSSPKSLSPDTKNKQIAALNASFDDSPKPVYHLRPNVVNGILLEDLTGKKWRIGKPIGKGNFGEIFLASDNVSVPVTSENAAYVVKIEPHSNGPLFVEIHCLLNAAKKNDNTPLPPGMPEYIASGSHYFSDTRYRFLVIKRYDRDLHSLIKNRRITQKSVLTLALQILDVLQHLHDKGYCHNDIKAQNLMISKCTYRKSQLIYGKTNMDEENCGKIEEKVNNSSESEYSDSGNSSNDEDCDEEKYNEKVKVEEKNEDDDDEGEEEDDDDESKDYNMYKTPINKKNRTKPTIQYSGSNPVRSCRRDKRNSIYDEMVKSHYLRPAKRICYSEFFNEENSKDATDTDSTNSRQVRTSVRKAASVLKKKRKRFISDSSEEENEDDEEVSEKNEADDDSDEIITEERVCLIDFGLASKFIDKGVHRPFVMDQRRAHDGTLEFTSRDAHMGAHSRRSDLECLGYNLVYWSQGYLPWRDAAAQHQNEKVHWVKEYLMKDVKEMMKHIYGKQVPKYLGEYLQYVGKLAYHERPDYEKCRRIFLREYVSLGYNANNIHLSTDELIKTSIKVKEEIENNNVIEMKNIKSIMKNLNVIMPFHESTLSNRVSPKNLRSKSAKKKSSRKKFSWTEILSQDPDQIARDRAEKEFDREPIVETPLIRYKGNPTYAILEIQNRLKLKDRIAAYVADGDISDEEEPPVPQIKAYSVKKRNTMPVIHEVAATPRIGVNCYDISNNKPAGAGAPPARSTRTKACFKTALLTTSTSIATTPSIANTTSTKRGPESNASHLTTNKNTTITENKKQRRTRRQLIKTGSTGDFTTTDESSCSSITSNNISINTNHAIALVKIKGIDKTKMGRVKGRRRKVVNRSDRCSSTDRSSNNSSHVNSEDETSNFGDHSNLFSAKKKRGAAKKLNNKLLHSAKTVSSPACLGGNEDVVGAKRRKRSIPKKRKSSTKEDCSEGEMLNERDLRTFKKRACRG